MNVTSEQVLYNAVDIKTQQRKKNLKLLLEMMRPGKSYRPYQFKDLPVKESTIWSYLRQLEDEGHIKRHIMDGHLIFIKP